MLTYADVPGARACVRERWPAGCATCIRLAATHWPPHQLPAETARFRQRPAAAARPACQRAAPVASYPQSGLCNTAATAATAPAELVSLSRQHHTHSQYCEHRIRQHPSAYVSIRMTSLNSQRAAPASYPQSVFVLLY
jgi:hypothetical protein